VFERTRAQLLELNRSVVHLFCIVSDLEVVWE